LGHCARHGKHDEKAFGQQNRRVLGVGSKQTEWLSKRAKWREWTKQDVRELKSSARQKMPATKIAKSLKRTGNSRLLMPDIRIATGSNSDAEKQ
jgi:hypothetical protein